MPFNGSGVFQRLRNWVDDATAGIKIRADYHDAEDNGFAAGLSNCITRDGQSLITQNIPFNAKRVTGLEDPVNPQDAATKAYTDTKFTGGGTMTGDLEIEKDNPTMILNDTAGRRDPPELGSAQHHGAGGRSRSLADAARQRHPGNPDRQYRFGFRSVPLRQRRHPSRAGAKLQPRHRPRCRRRRPGNGPRHRHQELRRLHNQITSTAGSPFSLSPRCSRAVGASRSQQSLYRLGVVRPAAQVDNSPLGQFAY